MRREHIVRTSVAAFALFVGTGIAMAQGAAEPAAPSASATMARQVSLTPAEEIAQAEQMLTRMDGARTMVRRQLETARLQRDVVKTLCLNDKLNQLDVAIRSGRERKQALDAAAARNDADLARHEFTILGVLRQRADQLSAESNQCIGTTETFMGDKSEVAVQVEANMPEDPAQYPNTTVLAAPPACASCFK